MDFFVLENSSANVFDLLFSALLKLELWRTHLFNKTSKISTTFGITGDLVRKTEREREQVQILFLEPEIHGVLITEWILNIFKTGHETNILNFFLTKKSNIPTSLLPAFFTYPNLPLNFYNSNLQLDTPTWHLFHPYPCIIYSSRGRNFTFLNHLIYYIASVIHAVPLKWD